MVQETTQNQYTDKTATVVGGKGELGRKIVSGLNEMGFRSVMVCEQKDPFTEFVPNSDTIFFAVDAAQALDMLQAARQSNLLRADHNILDGSSVKTSLVPIYKDLDHDGISVSSTHLGAVPAQPWRGVKVWLCEVGPNSTRAQQLAEQLFIAKNTSIQKINIEEHANVERVQWFTFATVHVLSTALRQLNFPLAQFNKFATLNAELLGLPIGRTLGQGTKVPSEILFTQPKKAEFLKAMQTALADFTDALADQSELQQMMAANIEAHDDNEGWRGYIEKMFKKAGIVGARNANLRMYSFSFRIVDDQPGKLRKLLKPFNEHNVNITAIDSMVGVITPIEKESGINPDDIVDFDIGVDLNTMTPGKEQSIKEALWDMGCTISYSGHQLS